MRVSEQVQIEIVRAVVGLVSACVPLLLYILHVWRKRKRKRAESSEPPPFVQGLGEGRSIEPPPFTPSQRPTPVVPPPRFDGDTPTKTRRRPR